ncbi:MAG: dTDP-4-dehydrorhamnose 3,5-epimerase [Burkholderiales bacterium]
MRATPSDTLPEVLIIEPRVFGDERGFFLESWNEKSFAEIGITARFVQDNHSRSAKGVLRGLHYQIRQPQGKLLRVIAGEVFDVVVDIRRSSPNFGKHFAITLNSDAKKMIWVPVGFAHGFCVTSEYAEVLYKTTDFYAPEHERSIIWNDPDLAISWPTNGAPLLSRKDAVGSRLREADFP